MARKSHNSRKTQAPAVPEAETDRVDKSVMIGGDSSGTVIIPGSGNIVNVIQQPKERHNKPRVESKDQKPGSKTSHHLLDADSSSHTDSSNSIRTCPVERLYAILNHHPIPVLLM